MSRAFSAEAMAECDLQGRHHFRWVHTWGDLGFEECRCCGLTRHFGTREECAAAAAAPPPTPPAVTPTNGRLPTAKSLARRQEVLRLLGLGMRRGRIAEVIGVHPSRVSQILTEARNAGEFKR